MLIWMTISFFLSAATLAVAIQKRDAPKSRFFIVLNLAISIYILGRLFESAATNLEASYFGVILSYIGLPFIPAIMLLFLLDFHDFKLNKKPLLIIFVPLFLATIFVAFPGLRHFYYTSYSFSQGPPISAVVTEGTAYFYAMFQYHVLLNIVCLALAIWGVIKYNKTERWSSMIVFIAVLLPMIAEILYVIRLTPMQLEIAPIALSVSTILLCISVFRLNLLRVLPLAKDAILDQMNDAFIIVDNEKRFIEANEAAKTQFPLVSLFHIGQKLEIADLFPEVFDEIGNRDLVSVPEDSLQRYYQLSEHIITQKDKNRCICYTLHDVTDTRKMMMELKAMAKYDSLTGIYNRASFYELAENELKQSIIRRFPVSAIAVDIDNFKEINDTYGHYCGDEVLKSVVQRISDRLRTADVFGRIGGDEFIIILPNTKLKAGILLAENLQLLVADHPVVHNGRIIPLTISIGIVEYDSKRHEDLEDLLIDTDTALFKSKKSGRNNVSTLDVEA